MQHNVSQLQRTLSNHTQHDSTQRMRPADQGDFLKNAAAVKGIAHTAHSTLHLDSPSVPANSITPNDLVPTGKPCGTKHDLAEVAGEECEGASAAFHCKVLASC